MYLRLFKYKISLIEYMETEPFDEEGLKLLWIFQELRKPLVQVINVQVLCLPRPGGDVLFLFPSSSV